jgi:hypothetical protein
VKIPLTYGAAIAIAGALLTLILFFAGFHDSVEAMQSRTAQTVSIVVPVLITIVCLALAMRDKRETTPPDAKWGYGAAVATGVMTVLFSVLFGAVFAYIYFAVLNPEMSSVIYDTQIAKMEEQGVPASQIDQSEAIMRKMLSPVMMTVFQGVMGFISGVVLSLIVAIFYKRRSLESGFSSPPPVL